MWYFSSGPACSSLVSAMAPDARRCTAPTATHLEWAAGRCLNPFASASPQESEWWTSSLGKAGWPNRVRCRHPSWLLVRLTPRSTPPFVHDVHDVHVIYDPVFELPTFACSGFPFDGSPTDGVGLRIDAKRWFLRSFFGSQSSHASQSSLCGR